MIKDKEGTSQVTWIILNAVNNMQSGVDKLALFLKGSKSKLVVPIESKQLFGGLMWHDIPTIKGFIKQLIGMELIRRKTVHCFVYAYPILELTEAGKKVLDEKINIELQIIKEQKPITVGESEEKTFELFSEGKTIEEIAKERSLAISTIYTHFYKLISNNFLSSSDVVPDEVIKHVADVYKKFKTEPKLKELKEKMPENISYEELRCVLAGLRIEHKEKNIAGGKNDKNTAAKD